ncbi:hypothetical protein ZWY2020_011032, partial [Hordeum vulgare]
DLARFGLPVPPSARLPLPWRISADGHPNLGPPALRGELRRHPGGRYDRRCPCRFWTGKIFDDVISAFRRVARGLPAGDIPWEASPSRHCAAAPATTGPSRRSSPAPATPSPSRCRASAPAAAAPPASPEDGNPDETPGLLAALAQSTEEAARAAAEEALDEAQAVALEAAAEEDDWLLCSSNDGGDVGDGDGDDDGGDVAVIDLPDED